MGVLIYIHVVYENNEKPSASFMATGFPSAPGLKVMLFSRAFPPQTIGVFTFQNLFVAPTLIHGCAQQLPGTQRVQEFMGETP